MLTDAYPVYDWQTTPLFDDTYYSPLQFYDDTADYPVADNELAALGDAFAAAGFFASPTPGGAAIVVGNEYDTIVNGFCWEELIPKSDGVAGAK